jgi:hypothetical protein
MPGSQSPPSYTLIALYPRTDPTSGRPTTFHQDYYLVHHIPLAERLWGPYGMTFHSITPLEESSGYHLVCVMSWTSKAAYEKASGNEDAEEVMADVRSGRITDGTPVFLGGGVV